MALQERRGHRAALVQLKRRRPCAKPEPAATAVAGGGDPDMVVHDASVDRVVEVSQWVTESHSRLCVARFIDKGVGSLYRVGWVGDAVRVLQPRVDSAVQCTYQRGTLWLRRVHSQAASVLCQFKATRLAALNELGVLLAVSNEHVAAFLGVDGAAAARVRALSDAASQLGACHCITNIAASLPVRCDGCLSSCAAVWPE